MTTTPKEEEAYLAGSNAAWRMILSEALKHLGGTGIDLTKERLILERSAAIASLRKLHGELSGKLSAESDWPDDLHLVDIIEKHIVPHIDELVLQASM